MQIEPPLAREVVQRQRRRILLRAGQRGRDLAIDRVVEDAPAHLRIGHLLVDQPGEGPLRVQPHREQPRAPAASMPSARAGRGRHGPRLGAERASAQRIGEARGRVDGATPACAARRRAPSTPSAAEIVVLPTPPGPTQTRMRFSRVSRRIISAALAPHHDAGARQRSATRTSSTVTLSGPPASLAASTSTWQAASRSRVSRRIAAMLSSRTPPHSPSRAQQVTDRPAAGGRRRRRARASSLLPRLRVTTLRWAKRRQLLVGHLGPRRPHLLRHRVIAGQPVDGAVARAGRRGCRPRARSRAAPRPIASATTVASHARAGAVARPPRANLVVGGLDSAPQEVGRQRRRPIDRIGPGLTRVRVEPAEEAPIPSIAIAAATSPALCPPIPSATTNRRASTKLPNASSFSGRCWPGWDRAWAVSRRLAEGSSEAGVADDIEPAPRSQMQPAPIKGFSRVLAGGRVGRPRAQARSTALAQRASSSARVAAGMLGVIQAHAGGFAGGVRRGQADARARRAWRRRARSSRPSRAGRSGTPSRSAWNCISRSLAAAPPSTRRWLIGRPASVLHRAHEVDVLQRDRLERGARDVRLGRAAGRAR